MTHRGCGAEIGHAIRLAEDGDVGIVRWCTGCRCPVAEEACEPWVPFEPGEIAPAIVAQVVAMGMAGLPGAGAWTQVQ